MNLGLAFTAFNRPHYLEESISSWLNVRNLYERWVIKAFVEPSPIQHIILDKFLNFQFVSTHLNEKRLGVLVNPWTALDTMFYQGAEFTVLAEDDIVVSQDVLEYMEWAAREFRSDESVLAICAYSKNGGSSEHTVFKSNHFAPLVWGTWKDRWQHTLRDTWDKDYSTGNANGTEAGWDWNINRILKNQNKVVIQPHQSRSDHIGKLGGTHMLPEFFDESRGTDFKLNRLPISEYVLL